MGPTAETQGCRAASARSTSGGFPEPGREPGPKPRAPGPASLRACISWGWPLSSARPGPLPASSSDKGPRLLGCIRG